MLWQTTGGAATQVASFGSGPESELAFLTNANSTLFFSVGRDKLYKHTTGAPVLVKTVEPGNFGPFAAVGSKVFFTADNGVNGVQLWVSDGTSAGTKQVKIIGDGRFGPANFGIVGGVLYFTANNGVAGEELWKSDGTAAGTVQVKNIAAGSAEFEPRDDH